MRTTHRNAQRITTALTATTLIAALSACDGSSSSSSPSAQDVKDQASQAAETATEFASNQLESYKQTMQDGLDQVDAQIESLQDRAGELSGDAKAEINSAIDALKQQRDEFAKSIDDARADSAAAFSELKNSMDKAWKDLETGANNAVDKFGA